MHIIEEILRITARLQSRKFGQALILLQVLSSHPHVFIMFLCESMNFHPNKQLFPSCRRMGSNSWPLDYKAIALPLHHWGPTYERIIQELKFFKFAQLLLCQFLWREGFLGNERKYFPNIMGHSFIKKLIFNGNIWSQEFPHSTNAISTHCNSICNKKNILQQNENK